MRFFAVLLLVVFFGAEGRSQSDIDVDPGIAWFEALRQEGVPEETLGVIFGVDPSVLSPAEPLPLPQSPIPASPFDGPPVQVFVQLNDSGPVEAPIGPFPLPGGPLPPSPFYPGPELDYLRSADVEEVRRLREESGAETSYGVAYAVREAQGLPAGATEWAEELAITLGPDQAGLATSKAFQTQMIELPPTGDEFEAIEVKPREGIDFEEMGFGEMMSIESDALFAAPSQ